MGTILLGLCVGSLAQEATIAPLSHVKAISRPTMVVAGVNDPHVPKSEADQMVKALEANGMPVWYLAAKDEGHGFAKKKNADFQFYTTVLFHAKVPVRAIIAFPRETRPRRFKNQIIYCYT